MGLALSCDYNNNHTIQISTSTWEYSSLCITLTFYRFYLHQFTTNPQFEMKRTFFFFVDLPPLSCHSRLHDNSGWTETSSPSTVLVVNYSVLWFGNY